MQCSHKPLRQNLFNFVHSKIAATHNSASLKHNNYDLETMFLSVAKGFHLARESESRPTTHIEQLLQDHPLWKQTKALLGEGCTRFLQTIDPDYKNPDSRHNTNGDTHSSTKAIFRSFRMSDQETNTKKRSRQCYVSPLQQK